MRTLKKLTSIIIIFILGLTIPIFSRAAEVPVYDSTFNNGAGAFYANGTPITIKENASNQTEITWAGGSQIITDTTTVFGGGIQGTTYQTSDITMESGTVAIMYGGGQSLIENENTRVEKTNITINGGTITESLYGGGLIYATSEESNITVNNGIIKSITGGGCAAAAISGTLYAAGTEENPELSKNRVDITNITINNGTINSTANFGMIFGGGQGYSYVGDANLTINGGDLSKAYVTAGGSNGYTENGDIKIKGGTIYLVQSVNRGKVIDAEVKMTGGTVEKFYVGGETEDAAVTGIVNDVEVDILGGTVTNLKPGKSNSTEIIVEQENYKVVDVEGTVNNSTIGEKEISITYIFNIKEETLKINQNDKIELTTEFITTPAGYEYLFEDKTINWSSDDETIATVDQTGNVTGIREGKTIVRGNLLNEDFVNIEVVNTQVLIIVVISMILLALLATILFIIATLYFI